MAPMNEGTEPYDAERTESAERTQSAEPPGSAEPPDTAEDAGIPRQPARPSIEEAPDNEPVASGDGSDEQLDVDTSEPGPARIRSHIRPGNPTQSVPIEDTPPEGDPGTETESR